MESDTIFGRFDCSSDDSFSDVLDVNEQDTLATSCTYVVNSCQMLTLENFSEKSFWNQKMDTSDTIKHNAVNGTISS